MSDAGKTAEAKEFSVSRVVNAPRDVVWRAWSQRDHLAKWWGPMGCKLDVRQFAFEPGGIFHYGMGMPDGQTWWGRFVYREIVKPERIVFVSSFSDEKGGLVRAPFSPAWPLEVVNTLTLSDEGGRTAIALRGGPLNATADERKMFEGMFDSMRQGFGGTFDQLEAYLAKM